MSKEKELPETVDFNEKTLLNSFDEVDNNVFEINDLTIGTPFEKKKLGAERAVFKKSEVWKKVREEVWKRDNATCQNCGTQYNPAKKTFEVHHIITFEHKEFRTLIKNLILLCHTCHKWTHSKKNIESKYLNKGNYTISEEEA